MTKTEPKSSDICCCSSSGFTIRHRVTGHQGYYERSRAAGQSGFLWEFSEVYRTVTLEEFAGFGLGTRGQLYGGHALGLPHYESVSIDLRLGGHALQLVIVVHKDNKFRLNISDIT